MIVINHQSVSASLPRVLFRSMRFLGMLLLASIASAQDQTPDLTQMSLEQLAKIEVTSVSKKEQKLSDTAAAIYVITQQDIRNSSATNVPELLRGVPGLDVMQMNGTRWAVSARGFGDQYANKMLVLIDGRSLFDTIFPGVVWGKQDIMLEDIERIEIIRGPGATVWGTNAVNGVINIITKPAKETPGTLVTAGAGNRERSFASARYGGALGRATHYRLYAKYLDAGPAGEFFGQDAHDSSRSSSGGFRIDSNSSDRSSFILEGRGFFNNGGLDQITLSYAPPYSFPATGFLDTSGENLMGRWTRKSLTGAETTVQLSYSHELGSQPGLNVNENIVNIAMQHEMPLGSRHDLVAGVQYDFRGSRTSASSPTTLWNPSDPHFGIAGGFIQDEMLFANGAIRITTGLRVEHNSLSGMGFQPNSRVLWKINPVHSIWVAYGLANRSAGPSDTTVLADQAVFPSPVGIQVLRYVGNPKIKSEKLHAFEMGYRVQPSKKVSLDLSAFYNKYYDIVGPQMGPPFFEFGPPFRIVLPLVAQNGVAGSAFGGEFSAKWVPVPWLHLGAAYSLLELDLKQSAAFPDTAGTLEGQAPRHQLHLDSSVNLTHTMSLNTALSFVDRTSYLSIPGYTQVDSKLAWRPRESSEFSIGAKNLFNKEHVEFYSVSGGLSTTLGRSVYGKATWHF